LERSGILAFHGTSEPKRKLLRRTAASQAETARRNERRYNLKIAENPRKNEQEKFVDEYR
jgi:hypothetical protein